MARRMFTIELKVDLEADDPRHPAIMTILARYSREILASTMILAQGTKAPEIVFFTEDQFFTTETIPLFNEAGEPIEEYSAPKPPAEAAK